MKKSFNQYLGKTKISFEQIQKQFKKMNPQYVPELQITKSQLFLNSPKKKQEAINKDFFNKENVYLRVISLMKQFVFSEEKSFMSYLQWNVQLKILTKLFSKIQLEKNKLPQFQIFYYLILTNKKKLFKVYLKFRDEILQKCTFDKVKNDPICLHNQSKYTKEQVFIGQVQVDFQACQFMIQYFQSQIPIQMIEWLGQGKKSVNSIKLLLVFLWQNQNKELVHLLSSQMQHQNI